MGFIRQKLRFREVEESDLEMLRKWRNDPGMSAGWHSPLSVQTMDEQKAWYESLNVGNQAFIAEDPCEVKILTPEHTEFFPVGLLRFRLDGTSNEARITGIDVAFRIHGKGYGKRILRAGAEYVLNDLGYHRATGEALDTNLGAQKIILASGFKQEGILREYVWRNGEWHDWFIYSLLRDELWPKEEGVAAGD